MRVLLLAASATLLLLLAAALAMPLRPALCGSCHEIRPYYESWRKSVHGRVRIGCELCHVEPGLIPAIRFRMNFFPGIFSAVTGVRIRTFGVAKAETKMCRRCHSLNREQSTSGDLKISHRKHVEKARLGCQNCHAGVVHTRIGRLGPLNPPRKLCMGCHKKEMKQCGFCHLIKRQQLPSFRHGVYRLESLTVAPEGG